MTKFLINKLGLVLSLWVFFQQGQVYGAESKAIYRASDGPVQAVLELNEGLIGKLTVSYKGELYKCGCGTYSCEGNQIKVVFIGQRVHPTTPHIKHMTPECSQPYGGGGQNRSVVSVGESFSTTAIWWKFQDIQIWRETIGDLAHYYRNRELPERLWEMQVAFEYEGQWDSLGGHNYRLNFIRVEE